MPEPVPLPTFDRYLAVDLHKDYVVVGGVNARLELTLSPRRVEMETWPRWAKSNLNARDALVVESTSIAWDFYDQVAPLVGQAVVANPRSVKLIAAGRVKTDKVDTLALAVPVVLNHGQFVGLFPDVDLESVPEAPGTATMRIEANVCI